MTAGIRRAGAAALDLAYVASGRLDGFWEFGLNEWDVAAGSLLILEAGGNVGVFCIHDVPPQPGNIIAGNFRIFDELKSRLEKIE